MNPIQAAELAGGLLNIINISEENKTLANTILHRALTEINEQTQKANLASKGVHLIT